MDKKFFMGVSGAILLISMFAYVFFGTGSPCSSINYYEDNEVSFNYPKNWQTFPNFWPPAFGFQFKPFHDPVLNADIIIGVLDPESKTHHEKFTTSVNIERKSLSSDLTLKEVFDFAYPKDDQNLFVFISERNFMVDGQTAYEKIYKKPHGEPWYQIRDVWLEKNGKIYIISCHALPKTYKNVQKDFDVIINSFHIK